MELKSRVDAFSRVTGTIMLEFIMTSLLVAVSRKVMYYNGSLGYHSDHRQCLCEKEGDVGSYTDSLGYHSDHRRCLCCNRYGN